MGGYSKSLARTTFCNRKLENLRAISTSILNRLQLLGKLPRNLFGLLKWNIIKGREEFWAIRFRFFKILFTALQQGYSNCIHHILGYVCVCVCECSDFKVWWHFSMPLTKRGGYVLGSAFPSPQFISCHLTHSKNLLSFMSSTHLRSFKSRFIAVLKSLKEQARKMSIVKIGLIC